MKKATSVLVLFILVCITGCSHKQEDKAAEAEASASVEKAISEVKPSTQNFLGDSVLEELKDFANNKNMHVEESDVDIIITDRAEDDSQLNYILFKIYDDSETSSIKISSALTKSIDDVYLKVNSEQLALIDNLTAARDNESIQEDVVINDTQRIIKFIISEKEKYEKLSLESLFEGEKLLSELKDRYKQKTYVTAYPNKITIGTSLSGIYKKVSSDYDGKFDKGIIFDTDREVSFKRTKSVEYKSEYSDDNSARELNIDKMIGQFNYDGAKLSINDEAIDYLIYFLAD